MSIPQLWADDSRQETTLEEVREKYWPHSQANILYV
jgi:hypothetical protein